MCKVSNGNQKLGKIANISLTPCKACPKGVPCAKKGQCYALKALIYPKAAKNWADNLRQAKRNPAQYFAEITAYLERKSPKMFRWHVSGDILNQDYLERMKRVAIAFPNIKFLAFTKAHHLDFTGLPANLSIVASMWPGWGNENAVRAQGLSIAWMQDGTENRVSGSAIECPGNCDTCGVCWSLAKRGLDVVFNKH